MTDITRKKHTGEPGNGGQFGSKTNSEADDVTLSAVDDPDFIPMEEETKQVLAHIAEARKNRPYELDLVYVDYSSEFSDEETNLFLAGDYAGLDDSMAEWVSDSRYDRSTELAESFCDEIDVDYHDLDGEQQERICEFIRDNDNSDPVKDLARSTGDKLLRAPLDPDLDLVKELRRIDPSTQAYSEYAADRDETREKALTNVLSRRGIDTNASDVKEAISTFVTEGPANWHEGVRLDVIWYGDITDATCDPALAGAGDGQSESRRNISFPGGAYLVLLDTYSGSGMDAEVKVPLSVTVTPESPAQLDSARSSHGYGWDDTAGVVHSAYRADTTTEWAGPSGSEQAA